MNHFNLHLPLPIFWDIDNLRLKANNDFTNTPKIEPAYNSDLIKRLETLEQKVYYLERKVNNH